MTDTSTSTEVAVPGQDVPIGSEDFDGSGLTMPRYNIDGRIPAFVNKSAGIEYPELDVVVLGSMRTRVLWLPEMPDDPKDSIPLCRSLDGKIGRPDLDFPGDPTSTPPKKARAGTFPWDAVPPEFKLSLTEDGTVKCGDCPLKEWGSHPTQDKPWCSDQRVWLVVFPDGLGGLLTFQRSALQNALKYEQPFHQAGTAMMTVRTKITLEQRTRGQVTFAIPHFKRGEATDEAEYPQWTAEYRAVRAYLHTPREPRDEAAATPATAVVESDFDEAAGDLPF